MNFKTRKQLIHLTNIFKFGACILHDDKAFKRFKIKNCLR